MRCVLSVCLSPHIFKKSVLTFSPLVLQDLGSWKLYTSENSHLITVIRCEQPVQTPWPHISTSQPRAAFPVPGLLSSLIDHLLRDAFFLPIQNFCTISKASISEKPHNFFQAPCAWVHPLSLQPVWRMALAWRRFRIDIKGIKWNGSGGAVGGGGHSWLGELRVLLQQTLRFTGCLYESQRFVTGLDRLKVSGHPVSPFELIFKRKILGFWTLFFLWREWWGGWGQKSVIVEYLEVNCRNKKRKLLQLFVFQVQSCLCPSGCRDLSYVRQNRQTRHQTLNWVLQQLIPREQRNALSANHCPAHKAFSPSREMVQAVARRKCFWLIGPS